MPARIGDPKRRRRHFIKEWRVFRRLTQQKLADMIASATGAADISKGWVSRIESLEIGYTQDNLEAIADALGTHPGILLMRAPISADGVVVEMERTKEKRPPPRRREAKLPSRARKRL